MELEEAQALPKKLFDSLTPDKQPKETQFGKTVEIGAGMFVIYSENEGNGQFTFCVIANGTYMNQIQITAISDDPWILIKQKRFPSFPTDILMASMIATIWTAYSSLKKKKKENVAPRIDEIEVKLDKIFRRPGSPLFHK